MDTNANKQPPAPEELHAHGATPATGEPKPGAKEAPKNAPATPLRRRLRTYRPSHKATFIGIGAIVGILAINVGVIIVVIHVQPKQTDSTASQNAVTIDTGTLSKLGVNRDSVGASETQLTIGPNSKFNGSVTVGSDVNVAGQLKLNGPFSASAATLTKLQAGDTALQTLNVNGDGTVSTLNLRKDLQVAGTTRLQGPVTIGQLLTVNNSLNVSGNLAIGGTFSTRSFEALSLATNNLSIGGHITTSGSAPGVGPGSALGANGTVSISGNDAAGTVAVNTGTGAGNGTLAQISFRTAYSGTPHVVVTPIGAGVPGFYITRTAYGFTIGVAGAMAPGGYAFDFIVMQ